MVTCFECDGIIFVFCVPEHVKYMYFCCVSNKILENSCCSLQINTILSVHVHVDIQLAALIAYCDDQKDEVTLRLLILLYR